MAFTGLGGCAFSYKPLAFKIMQDKSKNDMLFKYFLKGMSDTCRLSNTVQSYCHILGCSPNDLGNLLDGKIVNGAPDTFMRADFRKLIEGIKESVKQVEFLKFAKDAQNAVKKAKDLKWGKGVKKSSLKK